MFDVDAFGPAFHYYRIHSTRDRDEAIFYALMWTGLTRYRAIVWTARGKFVFEA